MVIYNGLIDLVLFEFIGEVSLRSFYDGDYHRGVVKAQSSVSESGTHYLLEPVLQDQPPVSAERNHHIRH